MKVSVFGLGYVGCVTAAALAHRGHDVVGVDINEHKVRAIKRGESPLMEKDLDGVIHSCVRAGRLRATSDATAAVEESDLTLVCVGTPPKKNGSFDYGYLLNAIWQIAAGVKRKGERHLVAIRSTLLPGATETMVIPELEKISGKRVQRDFSVCVNPEFMREGSSLSDFENPPFVVIGSLQGDGGEMIASLYEGIGPVFHTSVKTAEALKYVCNAFHALKITFANEIGNICQALGANSHEVMDLFCRDTKLNISSAYLKPGFAFGGSCLPKDLRALLYQSKKLDIQVPVLSAVLESNQLQVQKAVDYVMETQKRKIGVVGITFKAGTDDLRESPMVALCEALIGKGLEVAIYDPNLIVENLVGANKVYIDEQIPHIGRLLCRNLEELVAASEVVVMGNLYEGVQSKLLSLNGSASIVDLVGLFGKETAPSSYRGICW